MTTIATDGWSMAGDGQSSDQFHTIVNTASAKVHQLSDGRIVGCCGNSFDAKAYRAWLDNGKQGDCPIQGEEFAALILDADGTVLWVDHKGREIETPAPCAIGSGQDYAIGALEAGSTVEQAVAIACKRDPDSGGTITVEHLKPDLVRVA